jgi:pimeloyl-ACP methyl ester carboxylesterase
MAHLDIDGTRLACVEHGTGEPVVLVHGSASDHRTWDAQLPAFGERYRTIAYSRRYHWPNAPIPEGADYAMEDHVADLAALVRSRDVAPVHLVGHSYGAFVCLLLAMREPGLVRSLALTEPPVITLFVSTAPKPAEVLALLLRRPRTAAAIVRFGATGVGPATKAARRGDMDAAMRIFGRAVLGAAAYARLSAARREQVRANAIRAEFVGSGLASLRDEAVRGVRVPTLLVCGEDSPALFHRLTERLGELLPHAGRVDVPRASHIVHEDAAPAYNAAVLAFLTNVQ